MGMTDTVPAPHVEDPFVRQLGDELTDKGFLVTSAEDLISWARTGRTG